MIEYSAAFAAAFRRPADDLRHSDGDTIYPCMVSPRIKINLTDRSKTLNRLSRIEGQVRGIAQMVRDERYCIDTLNQIQAVKAALARVESGILKDHAATCVNEAIASGEADSQREKFNELVDLFEKVKR